MAQTQTKMSPLEERLEGKKLRSLSTAFPAIWDPKASGEYIIGVYTGTDKVPSQRKDGKSFDTQHIKLVEWSDGCRFLKNNAVHGVQKDEVVSAAGDVLARALSGVTPGTMIGIEFLGLGEARRGNNAPKLFKAFIIE